MSKALNWCIPLLGVDGSVDYVQVRDPVEAEMVAVLMKRDEIPKQAKVLPMPSDDGRVPLLGANGLIAHVTVDDPTTAEMVAVLMPRDKLLELVKEWSLKVVGIRELGLFFGCVGGSDGRRRVFYDLRLDCAAQILGVDVVNAVEDHVIADYFGDDHRAREAYVNRDWDAAQALGSAAIEEWERS